jgi:hypothetical protein
MNLFLLSTDPRQCAKWHCDKHVSKMILETCQMLYCAHHVINPSVCDTWDAPFGVSGERRGYKKAHQNHPMTKWIRTSKSNYKFACRLALCLSLEFMERFGHTHASTSHAIWLCNNTPAFPKDAPTTVTRFPQCMPDEYKCHNPVLAYRAYYIGDKARFANWRRCKNGPPPWWKC